MTVAPEHDPLARSDKYRALRELGRGGMGEVFLAEHKVLGHRVVIKLLHPELSDKPTLVDRMRLEAQACAQLNHRNIVRVTDFERTPDGRQYFVMEYLPGRSLRDELKRRGGTMALADAIDFTRQALAGLAAAHERGLVHRDIKLDNLFVCDPPAGGSDNGEAPTRPLVKLLDFGVAKVLQTAEDGPTPLAVPTATGVVIGTPRFFAPEQIAGKPVDHRADLYSMGLVLYTLIAGRGPYDDCRTIAEIARAHLMAAPAPPSQLASQAVPPQLDTIILRCIAKQPDVRFASAAELSAALAAIGEAVDDAGSEAEASSSHATTPIGDTIATTPLGEAPIATTPLAEPHAALPSTGSLPTSPMAPMVLEGTHAMAAPPSALGETSGRPGPMTVQGQVRRYSATLAAAVMVLAAVLGAGAAQLGLLLFG
jgi:serine/threonine-protein kinase